MVSTMTEENDTPSREPESTNFTISPPLESDDVRDATVVKTGVGTSALGSSAGIGSALSLTACGDGEVPGMCLNAERYPPLVVAESQCHSLALHDTPTPVDAQAPPEGHTAPAAPNEAQSPNEGQLSSDIDLGYARACVAETATLTGIAHPLFSITQLGIDRRLLVNRKRQLQMYRVWMQGKFRKVGPGDHQEV